MKKFNQYLLNASWVKFNNIDSYLIIWCAVLDSL